MKKAFLLGVTIAIAVVISGCVCCKSSCGKKSNSCNTPPAAAPVAAPAAAQ